VQKVSNTAGSDNDDDDDDGAMMRQDSTITGHMAQDEDPENVLMAGLKGKLEDARPSGK